MRKPTEYNKGDKVMFSILNPKKMQHKFSGPYQIIEKLSPTIYIIEENGKRTLIHIERLKKYYERA